MGEARKKPKEKPALSSWDNQVGNEEGIGNRGVEEGAQKGIMDGETQLDRSSEGGQ